MLIEKLDVDFDRGFTALTGETGAGKSIILDALGLACGAKADASQIRMGSSRAEITATFEIGANSSVSGKLKETASDDDSGLLLLRRVIEEGRSRAFINGRPAAVSELRALSEHLVDVHAQHEHQTLTKPATQRNLLDAYGDAMPERLSVTRAWSDFQSASRALERARTDRDLLARERDEMQERAQFLQTLSPTAAEWKRLSEEQSRMAHSQTLMDAASETVNVLNGDHNALCESLDKCVSKLRAAAAFDPALGQLAELLDSAAIQSHEAAHGLRTYVEKFDLDPDRAHEVDTRMSELHQAARRYRIPVEQLEGLHAQTHSRLAELTQNADIEGLQANVTVLEQALLAHCEALTVKRHRGAKALEKNVNALIKSLALGNARFDVQLNPLENPSTSGAEEVQFRFSSHPSLPLQPIQKSASGGELARVALAVMVASAKADGIPTLVFDEVDVGVGGGVAAIVGANLRTLGKSRQVFAVTHQAQVAAYAHQHSAVRKLESKTARGITLQPLDLMSRTEELARMIAGRETTATTLAHASELLAAGQQE